MLILVIKNTANNTIYAMQELLTFLEKFNGIAFHGILAIVSFSLIFSLHSSTNLSIISFLRLQFL